MPYCTWWILSMDVMPACESRCRQSKGSTAVPPLLDAHSSSAAATVINQWERQLDAGGVGKERALAFAELWRC